MYEATDDVEGVLQTLMEGAEHELSVGRMARFEERPRLAAFMSICFRASKMAALSRSCASTVTIF